MVTAAALKQAWAAVVIQRHCRGYLVRRLYQLLLVATVTIQAYTRGWIARKRYKKVSYKSLDLMKFQTALKYLMLKFVCVYMFITHVDGGGA